MKGTLFVRKVLMREIPPISNITEMKMKKAAMIIGDTVNVSSMAVEAVLTCAKQASQRTYIKSANVYMAPIIFPIFPLICEI